LQAPNFQPVTIPVLARSMRSLKRTYAKSVPRQREWREKESGLQLMRMAQ